MATESHECKNCGASLAIPAQHDRYFTCRFCGSVLEDTTPPEQRDAGHFTIDLAHISVDTTQLVSYAAPRTRGPLVAAMVAIALIGLGVAGAIAIFASGIDDSTGANASGRTADGSSIEIFNYASAAAINSDTTSGPDLVAMSRGPDGDRVVYFDLDADPSVRWSADAGLDADTFGRFVESDQLVVVSVDTTLVALNRSNGAEAWRATLTDEHQPNLCTSCFARFGESVVTLTADGVLSAHAVADGTQTWAVTLTEIPRQIMDFGGQPAALDNDGESVKLHVFSLADGSVARRLPISCDTAQFGPRPIGIFDVLTQVDTGVVDVGDQTFGPCAQRWDPPGDGPSWSVDYAAPSTTMGVDDILVAGGSVIVAADGRADLIDSLRGDARALHDDPDVALSPVAADESVVVLAAESTRGTGSHELRGIDRATGNVKWAFALESTDRIDPRISGTVASDAWAADLTSAGLSVLQYRSDAAELVLQTIPLGSGTASTPTTIDLSEFGFAASLSLVGWTGDSLHVMADGTVLEINVLTGEITHQAP